MSGTPNDDVLNGGEGPDVLNGLGGDDQLNGNGGADELNGGDGDDVLDGGTGGDRMVGGAGNDVYYVDFNADVFGDGVIEAADGGVDEVRTLVDRGIMGLNVENLTALGTGDLFLGGSDGANVILGNVGDNYIVSEGGNDTINGGAGFDRSAYNLARGLQGGVSMRQDPGQARFLFYYTEGGVEELVGRVTLGGVRGSAIVEGLGRLSALGVDTVSNLEEIQFLILPPPDRNVERDEIAVLHLGTRQFGSFLQGTAYDDVLNVADFPGIRDVNGGFGADRLTGDAQNNYFQGEEGNDVIDGGANGPRDVHIGDISSYQLVEGTTGTLRSMMGTGADAGRVLVQLVDAGQTTTFLRITPTGTGQATVEGVGFGAALYGRDTLTNVEQLHVLVRNTPGGPIPPSQFQSINLAPVLFDKRISGSIGNDVINVADVADARDVSGGLGDDRITGDAQNNFLEGNEGNDVIDGGGNTADANNSGRDIVTFALPEGVAGDVVVEPGAGANLGKYVVRLVNEGVSTTWAVITPMGQGQATVQGVGPGAFLGTDTLVNVEELHFFVRGPNNGPSLPGQFRSVNLAPIRFGDFVAGSVGNDAIDLSTIPSAVNANGNEGDDAVTGTGVNNNLNGGIGNDVLRGLGGNDVLDAGSGADRAEGGDGDDYMIGGDGNDAYDGGAGNDTAAFRLPAPQSGAFRIVQGEDRDQGSLFVEFGQGATFERVFRVNTERDGTAVVIGLGSQAAQGRDVTAAVEGLQFLVNNNPFDPAQSVTIRTARVGTDGDDRAQTGLFGGGASDLFYGGDGRDQLNGNAGSDRLYGEAGDDLLSGGVGDDLIVGGEGIDRATFFTADPALGGVTVSLLLQGQAQNTGGLGRDTLIGIEQLSGTVFADRLTGDGKNNWLLGQGAPSVAAQAVNSDILSGEGGNDFLTVGLGNHQLDGGDGVDTVGAFDQFITGGLTIDLRLQGGSQQTGAGSWTIVEVENLSGYQFDDVLTGDAGANTLGGSLGSDRLNGGDGDDELLGGGFAVNDSGGTGLAGPIIFVEVSVGDGDDILDGGAGADRMRGGFGDDTYYVDQAGDRVIEEEEVGQDNGVDQVVATIDYDLPRGVERLTLAGAALVGRGNAGGNEIVGNELANELVGFAGDDELSGAGGVDVLDGSTGDDVLDGGAGADRLFGGDDDDVLLGGAGSDRLVGGDGDDRLEGGVGADRLEGDAGADTFLFGPADLPALNRATRSGVDRILDFSQADGDVIDLTAIDAVAGGEDDAFTFIDGAAFSRTAGELRFDRQDGATFLSGDLDGNGRADFFIRIDGLITPTADDFLL